MSDSNAIRVRSTGVGSELGLVYLLADVFRLGFPTIGGKSGVTSGHVMTGGASESIRCWRCRNGMTGCENDSC